MIQQEIGSVFIYEGTRYVIGEPIVGTKGSEYEGLIGTIFEFSGAGFTRRDRTA